MGKVNSGIDRARRVLPGTTVGLIGTTVGLIGTTVGLIGTSSRANPDKKY